MNDILLTLQNFGVSWTQLIENTVNFLLLLGLLYIFAYKPVLKMLDKRKAIIEKAMKEAEDVENQKTAMQKEYKKVLHEATIESKKIVQHAVEQSEVIAKKIEEDAKAQSASILAKSRDEITRERDAMYAGVKNEILQLLETTISKVLKEELTTQEQKHIFEKAIKEVKDL